MRRIRVVLFCLIFHALFQVAATAQSDGFFGNLLGGVEKQAEQQITKKVGEAVGVGSPLLLDQTTALTPAADITDFHPTSLTISSVEDLYKPLPPGDYSVPVTAFCTQFSIHAPSAGLPYKIARVQGKQAPAISALLARGMLQNLSPATLNVEAWRIQAGLPLNQWPDPDQALIHRLIPDYEKGLQGDYLQQIQNTYNKFALIPGLKLPPLNEMLAKTDAGRTVLQMLQARQLLADKTISAERLPDMLYQPTDGLPRVLPDTTDSSPSPWAEIQPGIFARFTVTSGNLGQNEFDFRITSKLASVTNISASPHVVNSVFYPNFTLDLQAPLSPLPVEVEDSLAGILGEGTFLPGSVAVTDTGAAIIGGTAGAGIVAYGATLFIGYEIGRYGAQALIMALSTKHKDDGARMQVWRVGSPNGSFWAPTNPSTDPDYLKHYGIPNNPVSPIYTGYVKMSDQGAGWIARPARAPDQTPLNNGYYEIYIQGDPDTVVQNQQPLPDVTPGFFNPYP